MEEAMKREVGQRGARGVERSFAAASSEQGASSRSNLSPQEERGKQAAWKSESRPTRREARRSVRAQRRHRQVQSTAGLDSHAPSLTVSTTKPAIQANLYDAAFAAFLPLSQAPDPSNAWVL